MTSCFPLIFLRHGETDWNRDLRLQGRCDTPLNELGRRQAARNGRALAGILRAGDYALVSSPLVRAAETMEIVLEAAGWAGTPFATDDRLVEISYGTWEGLTLPDIELRDADGLRRREQQKWTFAPPDGESYAAMSARVGRWLDSLDRPGLVVAHGGTMRVLLHLLAGLPAEDAPHLVAPQDRVMIFNAGRVATI
jgi:broad specificity phosphatase PhoE